MLFIISDNPTFEKEKFLNYKKIWLVKISPLKNLRMADLQKLVYAKLFEKADSRKLVLVKCEFFLTSRKLIY